MQTEVLITGCSAIKACALRLIFSSLYQPASDHFLRSTPEFELLMSVTERNGSIGIVKGSGENETFNPRGNFVLKIVAKVEGAKDGYVARVTRCPDSVTR